MAAADDSPTPKNRPSEGLRPVTRALQLLTAMGQRRTGWTQFEVSQALGLPSASVYRLLTVLESERFVVRSPTSKRYFIGPAALALAHGNQSATAYLASPHPQMRELASETTETIFATELQYGLALCVALVPCEHPLRLFVRIGQEMPLHAAASARVLLADLDESIAEKMLGQSTLTLYTDKTPRSIDQIIKHLETVRARGYDVCDDELDRGVWAVSAPVRQADGRVCSALTLAAPRQRVSAEQESGIIDKVMRAADVIGTDLGWHGAGSVATRERLKGADGASGSTPRNVMSA